MIVGWFILDNCIIVCFNLFDYYQPIYIVKDGEISNMFYELSTIEDLPEKLNNLCKCHNINNIKLKGTQTYLLETATKIKNYALLNCNNNEITVEILED